MFDAPTVPTKAPRPDWRGNPAFMASLRRVPPHMAHLVRPTALPLPALDAPPAIDADAPIFTDLDDVALDFMGGFAAAMSDVLGRTLDPRLADNWNLGPWMGVDDYIPYVKRFLASEAFGTLPAKPFAPLFFPTAAEAGHPIYAVTASATDKEATQRRLANLRALFGDIFQDVIFVPLGQSKRPHLTDLIDKVGRRGIWLEDNHKNARDGAGLGLETYVVRTPHNRMHEAFCTDPLLTWIDDLLPVAQRLGLSLPNPQG